MSVRERGEEERESNAEEKLEILLLFYTLFFNVFYSNDLVCKRTEMYLTDRLDRQTDVVECDCLLITVLQLSDFGLKTLHT